jgi:hypothetical protein
MRIGTNACLLLHDININKMLFVTGWPLLSFTHMPIQESRTRTRMAQQNVTLTSIGEIRTQAQW